MQDMTKPLDQVSVGDVDLGAGIENHAFVEANKPLFFIPKMFESRGLNHRIL
jgi:hypothetical protein